MKIRKFVMWPASVLVVVTLAGHAVGQESTRPISGQNVRHLIDTHIHLYDTRRPDGVPWPPAGDPVLYKPHLPAEYSRIAKAAGVTGVVIVEASDRLEDNQWVLDQVAGDSFYVALVGNIDPHREDFAETLKQLRVDERFVGIRARRAGGVDYSDSQVLKSFRSLQEAGLSLDLLANGRGVEGVRQIEALAGQLPDLRIIVDHVLGFNIDGQPPSQEWLDAVCRLAAHPNVYVKVSGLYQRCMPQPATMQLDHYRSVLDPLWEYFGQERLIYGSNWPCTKKSGDYASFVTLVDSYFTEKGQAARECYFWKNAVAAYGLKLP